MEELRTFGRLQASFLRKRQANAPKRKWTGYRTEVMGSVLENSAKRRFEQVRLLDESGCADSIELLRLIRIA